MSKMRKQKFIHVSFDLVSDFEPRIPSNRAKDEDAIKKRICCILSKGSLQDDVIHALNASPCAGEVLQRIVSHGFDPVLHVYEFQSTKYMFPWEVQEYVPDAIYSGECWLLDKPKKFIHKCYNVSSFKTESVKDFYENKWEAVVNIQLEKMKKNETNWERYCHIYGFGYKFLRVVHDMNISFKTFALSLDL